MLKKRFCLKGRTLFSALFKRGKRFRSSNFTVIFSKTGSDIDIEYDYDLSPKVGLSVGKRCGKAHERNRIKRRLRAALREYIPGIDESFRIIVRASDGVGKLQYQDLQRELRFLLKKSGIINL